MRPGFFDNSANAFQKNADQFLRALLRERMRRLGGCSNGLRNHSANPRSDQMSLLEVEEVRKRKDTLAQKRTRLRVHRPALQSGTEHRCRLLEQCERTSPRSVPSSGDRRRLLPGCFAVRLSTFPFHDEIVNNPVEIFVGETHNAFGCRFSLRAWTF
jgi:hypothetical protein